MEYNKAANIISSSDSKNFSVLLEDGKKENLKLFVSYGYICRYKKGSNRKGFMLTNYEVSKWVSVTPIEPESHAKIVIKFLTTSVKYMRNSGLWSDCMDEFSKLIELGEKGIEDFLSLGFDEQRDFLEKYTGVRTLFVDDLLVSALKGIKYINYDKYERESVKEKFLNALGSNQEYNYRWTKGYDNTISVDGEKKRAWYSEEYRGTGNGHYYIALDEKHAIFCETD